MDELSSQYMQRYQQLRAMRDRGQLTPQQFDAEIQTLQWQDSSGAWWAIDAEGTLLRHDGQRWVASPAPQRRGPIPGPASAGRQVAPSPTQSPQQGDAGGSPISPAAYSPAQAPVTPQPVTPGQPAGGAQGSGGQSVTKPSFLRSASPIVAILPALACGGAWFLYTFLGVFKYEGIRGVDCVTPLIVGGLPILFWVLKAPLDKALLPLKPVIQGVPRPLRLGVTLAIPLVFGCGLSTLSSSGYFALSVSALISVVAAAVLLRY